MSCTNFKVLLEDQLTTSQKRVDTIIELENELMSRKSEAEEAVMSRDHLELEMRELQEYVHRLEMDKNSTLNESANLEEELALARVGYWPITV